MEERLWSSPGIPVLASPTSRPRFSADEPHPCPLWARTRPTLRIPPVVSYSGTLQCAGGPRVKRGGSPRRGAAAGPECLVRIPISCRSVWISCSPRPPPPPSGIERAARVAGLLPLGTWSPAPSCAALGSRASPGPAAPVME